MTIDPTGAAAPGLIDRIKNILLTPQAEWDRITGEPADTNKLYLGYVLPLAAVAAICGVIGLSFIGVFGFRVGLVTALMGGVIQVVMGLVGVFALAFITNALAPNFGSQQDMGQAHKLAVYSSTAAFLAGVFALFPPLAILGIVGLYSFALLYIGLPRLMKTPEDKRLGYFITIVVVAIVVGIVLNVVMMSVRGALPGGFGAPAVTWGQNAPNRAPSQQGSVTLPGGGSIDVGEMQRQMEAAQSRGGAAIDPAALQARLPQALPGGFSLASTSSGSAMGSAQAEGEYVNGDARISVNVVHMGAMGAFAGMAAGMNVQQNEQNANGYSRTQTVNGRVITETVDNASRSASYGIVGRGVAVTAEGLGGVSIEQVRAVVDGMNIERLEREFAG